MREADVRKWRGDDVARTPPDESLGGATADPVFTALLVVERPIRAPTVAQIEVRVLLPTVDFAEDPGFDQFEVNPVLATAGCRDPHLRADVVPEGDEAVPAHALRHGFRTAVGDPQQPLGTADASAVDAGVEARQPAFPAFVHVLRLPVRRVERRGFEGSQRGIGRGERQLRSMQTSEIGDGAIQIRHAEPFDLRDLGGADLCAAASHERRVLRAASALQDDLGSGFPESIERKTVERRRRGPGPHGVRALSRCERQYACQQLLFRRPSVPGVESGIDAVRNPEQVPGDTFATQRREAPPLVQQAFRRSELRPDLGEMIARCHRSSVSAPNGSGRSSTGRTAPEQSIAHRRSMCAASTVLSRACVEKLLSVRGTVALSREASAQPILTGRSTATPSPDGNAGAR
ncbi:hypothetical protein AB3K78_09755 [Leucobacter sp. HNU]|uniref:hypothetical protein n=1 Tax=Leucobacter sp. HNU TaxID=3236805 RepID=UPI003A7FA5F7